jgi:hypothetical protein
MQKQTKHTKGEKKMILDSEYFKDNKANYACVMFSTISASTNKVRLCIELSVVVYDCDYNILEEYNSKIAIPDEVESFETREKYAHIYPDEIKNATNIPSQVQVLIDLTVLLDNYQVENIFTWNSLEIKDYYRFPEDILAHNLNKLSRVISFDGMVRNRVLNHANHFDTIRIGLGKCLEFYNIVEDKTYYTSSQRSVHMLGSIICAYATNQKINHDRLDQYIISIQHHKSKEAEIEYEDIGFYELELYMDKKSIKKAVNIAGHEVNSGAFLRRLEIAYFSKEHRDLLGPYYSAMRCARLQILGHNISEKIMKDFGVHPTFLIEKEIPKCIFDKAKNIAKENLTENIYNKKLLLITRNERQYKLLKQCYRTFQGEHVNKYASLNQFKKIKMSHKSQNAIRAENDGLYILRGITDDKLSQLGFGFGTDFFRWLCRDYVKPKEYHHVGTENSGKRMNIEGYYNDETIKYVVDNYDLPFMYQIFNKEIDIYGALNEKNITFCLVEAISSIVGIENRMPVKVYCVRQNNTFWFSKCKYLKMKDNNIRVLKEWNYPNSEYRNPNTRKVIRMLLSRKKQKIVRNIIK